MPVYLELFHGRKSPEQQMDDWGIEGPILGPFQYVHTTYANSVKLLTVDGHGGHIQLAGSENDLFFYDGVFYGDWSVFGEEALNDTSENGRGYTYPNKSANVHQRVQAFDAQKLSPAQELQQGS